MAGISGYDSNSISMLFSGLNSQKSSSNVFFGGNSGTNMGIDLSTYGLIRSGSYFKLMKSYYSLDGKNEAVKDAVASTSTSADSAKTLTAIKSTSENLSKAAESLYKSKDSDREELYKALDQFVEGYNSLIEATGKSNTSSIANASASMINNTANNAKLLGKAGIKIDSEDYTLSIDKDAFMKADSSVVSTLFQGTGSFAYATAVKASMINSYANIESSKSNTYNSQGNYTYNYNTGELSNTKF